ncbi:MAG: DMT family transporter [Lentimicrobium sp.]
MNIVLTSTRRGYLYALIATICGSLVYLFSKAALNEISLARFGFWWFSLAIFWNALFALHPKGGFSIRSFTRHDYHNLLLIGIFELAATVTFYTAIKVTANPAVPGFLRNLEYLFVTLLGIWLLAERFSIKTGAGAALILAGAFVISFRGTTSSGFMSTTALLMFVSTSFYAVRTILVKKHIREIAPVVLALNRAFFLFFFALVFIFITGDAVRIPLKPFLNILAGSFVGPFLTSIFQYSSLKYIPASRTAIIQSTTGLFVLTGALLMFGSFPTPVQVTGGLITIAGVGVMMGKRTKSHD